MSGLVYVEVSQELSEFDPLRPYSEYDPHTLTVFPACHSARGHQ